MKKLFLLLILSFIGISIFSQDKDYITDGNMETSSISPTVKVASWPAKGVWFSYWGSNKSATIETIDYPDKGKVIQTIAFTAYKQTDYDPWFGQRIADVPSAGIYRLSFKAKSTNVCVDPVMAITLRLKGTYQYKIRQAFKRFNFVYEPTSKELGGTELINLTPEWADYYIDFDLTKVVSSLAEPAWDNSQPGREYKVLDATEADRQDFYLTIQSFGVAGDFVVDDVSLTLSPLSDVKAQTINKMHIHVENSQIIINEANDLDQINLIDVSGQILMSKKVRGSRTIFEVHKPGIYILHNISQNNYGKVIVQ